EKHEFQDFLQQVTDRLKDMDEFLESETTKLESAQHDGQKFDDDIQSNVSTIRDDINQATGLPQLKTLVDTKLELISKHINTYRVAEKKRAEQSRDDVESMHQRMQALEQETESLKKVIVEKNQQAMFDALTKVPNRLFYEQKIEEEFVRWQRTDSPLTLAIWDIDFFKKINDNFGHKAGDKVLETIAQLLNKRIRRTDFFARYGGEEFVMLLPDTEAHEALKLVDDLRESIKSCSFHYRGEDVRVTASCGLSSFSQGDKVDQVFERADKALYEAKENGRNQCVLAS
ncbi:MAG: GGDEF domain-containing protein, partial [Gammaproteobacteria bacterium]